MKKILLPILALLMPVMMFAGVNDDKPIKQNKIVYLYPEGQGVDKGIVEDGVAITLGPGEDNGKHGPETVRPSGDVYDIGDSARMEIYFPENPNGLMIINCPGGAYWFVSEVNEGYCTVEWLLSQGIAVCNMFYRLPYGHKTVPLTDVQNAFRYCRYHAAEWGIDKIGVMGFSAGGHLVMSAGEYFGTNFLARYNIEPSVSLRPDFVAPSYPVVTLSAPPVHKRSRLGLLGEWTVLKQEMRDSLSLEKHVKADTPPVFLLNCVDDPVVDYRNSELLDSALTARGIPHLYMQYKTGGHGFGANPDRQNEYTSHWQKDFMDWIKNYGH